MWSQYAAVNINQWMIFVIYKNQIEGQSVK